MTKEEIYKHSMLEQIEKYTTTLAKLDNHYVYGSPLELTGVEVLKLRSLVQDKVMMYSKLLEESEDNNA